MADVQRTSWIANPIRLRQTTAFVFSRAFASFNTLSRTLNFLSPILLTRGRRGRHHAQPAAMQPSLYLQQRFYFVSGSTGEMRGRRRSRRGGGSKQTLRFEVSDLRGVITLKGSPPRAILPTSGFTQSAYSGYKVRKY